MKKQKKSLIWKQRVKIIIFCRRHFYQYEVNINLAMAKAKFRCQIESDHLGNSYLNWHTGMFAL